MIFLENIFELLRYDDFSWKNDFELLRYDDFSLKLFELLRYDDLKTVHKPTRTLSVRAHGRQREGCQHATGAVVTHEAAVPHRARQLAMLPHRASTIRKKMHNIA